MAIAFCSVRRFLVAGGWMVLEAVRVAAQMPPAPVEGPRVVAQSSTQGQTETLSGAPAKFDVATIKASKTTDGGMGLGLSSPDGIELRHANLKSMIVNAYGIKLEMISGGPSWVGSTEYDVSAKVLPPVGGSAVLMTMDRMKSMMQTLLAERFQLLVHTEVKELPVYELVVAKGGAKLHEAGAGDTYSDGLRGPGGRTGAGLMTMSSGGRFTGQAIAVEGLAHTLEFEVHRTVIDKTGLTGRYDIAIDMPRDKVAAPGGDGSAEAGMSGPSIFTLLEEQLALQLKPSRGPVKTLVIDRVARPTEN